MLIAFCMEYDTVTAKNKQGGKVGIEVKKGLLTWGSQSAKRKENLSVSACDIALVQERVSYLLSQIQPRPEQHAAHHMAW